MARPDHFTCAEILWRDDFPGNKPARRGSSSGNAMESQLHQQRVAELIGQHYELLFRVSFRLTGLTADAEDLTQQTFLTAHEKLHQLREADSAKGWLLAILRHHFFRNRSRTSRHTTSLEAIPEPTSLSEDPHAALESEELQAALNELPDEFRFPLVLFYFHELSYQEIATELSVPLGTVMSRLSRGKQHLRRRLLAEDASPRLNDSRSHEDSSRQPTRTLTRQKP